MQDRFPTLVGNDIMTMNGMMWQENALLVGKVLMQYFALQNLHACGEMMRVGIKPSKHPTSNSFLPLIIEISHYGFGRRSSPKRKSTQITAIHQL